MPPEPMRFDEGRSESWSKWLRAFEFYMKACRRNQEADSIRIATLLTVMGSDGQDIYSTFDFEDEETYDAVISKFTHYCQPQSNETFLRHRFRTRIQGEGEDLDHFINSLRQLVKKCGYDCPAYDETINDSVIRDQIVLGVRDPNLRERLLREDKLTLDKAIKISRASEASKRQAQVLAGAPSASSGIPSVDVLHGRAGAQAKKMENRSAQCAYCGLQHDRRKCPAYGRACKACGRMNHFASVCRSSKRVHQLVEQEHQRNTDVEAGNVMTLKVDQVCDDPSSMTIALAIEPTGRKQHFKVDTGADVNVLPLRHLIRIAPSSDIEPTQWTLKTYNQAKLDVVGTTNLTVFTPSGKKANLQFVVVGEDSTPIIGRKSATLELNLIKKLFLVEKSLPESTFQKIPKTEKSEFTEQTLLQLYPRVFKGVGCMKQNYSIKLTDQAQPKVQPPRRIPFAAYRPLAQELDRLEKEGTIVRVDEPTEWVSNVTIIWKKNGAMRLCLDPTYLNKFIVREYYPIPTAEQVRMATAGACIFSTFDATESFHQLKLDEKSSFLTTFHTPFGRYRWKRVPYGLSSIPEVFQKRMEENVTSHISTARNFFDDIIVWGSTVQEHDDAVKQLLERCQQANVTLNPTKMQVGVHEMKYLGDILGRDGLRSDPSKVTAIKDMPRPDTLSSVSAKREQLRRFLGCVTYLSKFCPHLSSTAEPLRHLLKKDVIWSWTKVEETAYSEIIKTLCSNTVLATFDPSKPVTVSVDSCQSGIGAVLLQDGRPIEYASAAMTNAQKNYAQIEKELLAIVYGCKKFHRYIWGRSVDVESDHKPLEVIFRKSLCDTTPRIQRLMLQLQPYDLCVRYVPGRNLHLADTLSRAQAPEDSLTRRLDEALSGQVLSIEKCFSGDQFILDMLKKATASDPTSRKLRSVIKNGWPERRSQLPIDLKNFWDVRFDMTFIGDLLCLKNRIYVPAGDTRSKVLQILHVSHPGIIKMDLKAKDYFYWPGIRKDIENVVNQCPACQSNMLSQSKETLMSVDIPDFPFQICATDLFFFQGNNYLLYVDAYSHWMCITRMQSTTSTAVSEVLKEHFANFGVPEQLISDGGPQYSGENFSRFMQNFGVNHRKSSPTYPQSNGLAERYVHTAKSIMKKCHQSGQSLHQALLHHRNTPIGSGFPSPAEMAFGRRLRCDLPSITSELRPREMFLHDSISAFEKARNEAAHYYNKAAHPLAPLAVGDSVWMQRGKRDWIPAEIVECVPFSPRSYFIRTDLGQLLRRNRRFLRLQQSQPSALKTSETDFVSPQHDPELEQPPYRTAKNRLVKQTKFYRSHDFR